MTVSWTDHEARFWARVTRGSRDECWEWQGPRSDRRYGMAYYRGRMWRAHRVAYTLANGPIPDGLLVCHRCDNPPCVNPAHLFLGTSRDNSQDASRKGRLIGPIGVTNGNAKFTPDAVTEIRRRYAAGGVSQYRLAAEYGVSQTAISKVVRRIRWAGVA